MYSLAPICYFLFTFGTEKGKKHLIQEKVKFMNDYTQIT